MKSSRTASFRFRVILPGVVLALAFIVAGCGGPPGAESPQRYGSNPETADQPAPPQEQPRAAEKDTTTATSTAQPAEQAVETARTPAQQAFEEHGHSHAAEDSSWSAMAYTANADYEDSASAVDDEIWRQLDLAEEYHAMGVIANREASWEEAQYYFEKALKLLAILDIEGDSLETPESAAYSVLLDDVVADYRVTLLSLGTLQEDVSAAVMIERFGDLANNLGDDSLRVFDGEKPEITYDIPITMNDRVKKSIVYYQTVAREAFAKFLRRSKRYERMMKTILTEYGLPLDLVYLSMVESGYNPRAYSWARASGLWQFIASTGRLYGLDRSWWHDERRDPIKSTHAACRFLKYLYEKFGSWELAMAAYNGGPGRVSRQIKKQNTRDFWKLRLRRQTMDYVPLIMAAAVIAKNPAKYGFEEIEFEDELVWDEVVIDKCLELSVVAREIGCSVDELQDLNPELLRKYTPPNEKKYRLKIPVGTKPKFLAAYDGMPSPKETSWVRHKIRRGETISTIASRYGVSQYAIMEANNLHRRSTIYAGHTIIVPVPLDKAPTRRRNGDYSAKNGIYVVRSGDTMWDISRAFGTSVDALRRINYIERGSRIYVGQKLKIPSNATYFADRNSGSYASTSPSGKTGSYKVRSGDTLWDIARRFGTTTSRLRSLNRLGRSSRIYPGQVLTIDGSGSSNPEYVIHRVRRGESLSLIARKYRTSIRNIIDANNINDPDRLRVGDRLKIYVN